MLAGKIINNEPKFDPITIQITIDSQDDLDKLTSLTNHSGVVNVFGGFHQLTNILKEVGGDSSKYLNEYTKSFKKY